MHYKKYPRFFLLSILIGVFSLLFFSPAITFAQDPQLNLSSQAQKAINTLAKDILLNGINPNITAIRPQLDPGDYAIVKNIGVLPDSPWYVLKNLWNTINIFFTFDEVSKTYKILQNGNEKMLESLLVLEKAEKAFDAKQRERLVDISAQTLESVGSDFDTVAKTIDTLKKKRSPEASVIEDQAFRFAGYYLKHQVLLEKQEDALSEKEFLLMEKARLAHLGSVAHIIVADNPDPLLFGQELVQLIAPQVGSNNSQLATIAILRDLENNASFTEQKPLRNAQSVLTDELEIKLSELPKEERLKQIQTYISFVHGNPIRQFQAYNALSKKFQSKEMTILTSALKDKAAQNFKKHLDALKTKEEQEQFVQALFSMYPIDMKLLLYTQIQLVKDTTNTDPKKSKQATTQIKILENVKALLGRQLCEVYGKNPKLLQTTRFYQESQENPTILDVRIGQFLNTLLQKCKGVNPEVLQFVAGLQTNINATFAKEAASEFFTTLPTKAQAEEILKEENIQASPQTEKQVAEKIEEETKAIEEKIPEDPTEFEKQVLDIVETITTPTQEGINEETIIEEDTQTIIDELINASQPTEEEVVAKEEQIVEEIVDASQGGETSPLVEELPQEVQEEIAEETNTPLPTATPLPTIAPTLAPIITTVPTLVPTVVPVITTAPTTAIESAQPTPVPTVAVPGL